MARGRGQGRDGVARSLALEAGRGSPKLDKGEKGQALLQCSVESFEAQPIYSVGKAAVPRRDARWRS